MIRKLTLENFKAFGQLELPLAPLTLLTAVNAAGKSTTMQALALLRQSWDAKRLGLRLCRELGWIRILATSQRCSTRWLAATT